MEPNTHIHAGNAHQPSWAPKALLRYCVESLSRHLVSCILVFLCAWRSCRRSRFPSSITKSFLRSASRWTLSMFAILLFCLVIISWKREACCLCTSPILMCIINQLGNQLRISKSCTSKKM